MNELSARFARSHDGNFAMMLAVFALPLVAGIGLAVDYSNVARHKRDMQYALDAATLYATREYELNGVLPTTAEVASFLEANSDVPITKVSGPVIIDEQVVITGESSYKPYFVDLLGAPVADSMQLEVAMVLDNTRSMESSGKIAGLKSAATAFLDAVFPSVNTGGNVRVAIVPFAQYVNVGTSNWSAAWLDNGGTQTPDPNWKGCIGTRGTLSDGTALSDGYPNVLFPPILNASCPQPILPLTADKALAKSVITAMVPDGTTYVADGVMWGQRVLSPGEPFTEGANPASSAKPVRKIMIVMTDGENTVSPNLPTSPDHEGSDLAMSDSWTQRACNSAKQAGIEVHTVTYGTQVPISAKNIMKRCASNPAYFYDAASTQNLVDAFSGIAKKMKVLRLTY
ncbi:MAG: TadE/TadG family protein [Notoacmeibacter sp.]|nr:TadE/TadG family protein [Notoacmeibacter sp.]